MPAFYTLFRNHGVLHDLSPMLLLLICLFAIGGSATTAAYQRRCTQDLYPALDSLNQPASPPWSMESEYRYPRCHSRGLPKRWKQYLTSPSRKHLERHRNKTPALKRSPASVQ